MNQTQIIGALVSAPVVLAATAYLRKMFPGIDGRWVIAVVVALSAVATILSVYADRIPAGAWALLATAITTLTATGSSAYVDSRVDRAKGNWR